jgi:hypothetical protein
VVVPLRYTVVYSSSFVFRETISALSHLWGGLEVSSVDDASLYCAGGGPARLDGIGDQPPNERVLDADGPVGVPFEVILLMICSCCILFSALFGGGGGAFAG